jgi:hypothetical protein
MRILADENFPGLAAQGYAPIMWSLRRLAFHKSTLTGQCFISFVGWRRKALRFFGDCAPKKLPLRGSSWEQLRWCADKYYAPKNRFAIQRIHHARPIERSLQ